MKNNITRFSIKGLLPLVALMIICFASCKKNEVDFEPVSKDMTKPAVVTNVKVSNLNGAANITYSLPNSENILYVLAKYNINGVKSRETQSSYYTDTIKVDGFEKKQEYEVTLYTVSRANVMSDPIVVKVNPDTPYYQLIRKSALIVPDFGGLSVTALNKGKVPVSVHILSVNDKGVYEAQEPVYTSRDLIEIGIRGFAATARKFALFVKDQYGNVSDTLIQTITPLFETLIDKSKFSVYKLPTDAPIGYGWELYYFWDGKTDGSSNGWHTTTPADFPITGTFSMGTSAKLSRFMLWERPDGSSYAYGDPAQFNLWGSNLSAPQDGTLPSTPTAVGTVVGDWTCLGTFKYPDPPSGNAPGFATDLDKAFVRAGVNFTVPISAPVSKFIRFSTVRTYGNVNYTHMMEISFYGKPQ